MNREDKMKKIIALFTVIVMAATLASSAFSASVANHLFDKQGGIDAGGQTWSVYGWIVTDAEITSVGYILDNGDISSYKAVVTGIENDTRDTDSTKPGESDAYRDLALEEAVKKGGMSGGVSWDILRAYRIQIVVDIMELEIGEHSVLVCLEFKDGGIAEAFRDNSEFTFKKAAPGEQIADGKGASTKHLVDFDNSDDTKVEATGWAGSTVKTVKLGYRIDDGETQFNDKYVKLIRLDENDPSDIAVIDLAGQYAFRFSVNIPINELPAGDHRIKLVMVDEDGSETVVGTGGGSEELLFYYESEEEATTTDTEPATDTETETDADTGTGSTDQSAVVTTEPAATEETAKTETKGMPKGAVIAIIVAAVAVIGVSAFLLIKKKK